MGPRWLLDHSRLRIKRSKTKLLADNVAILQIKQTFPPATNGINLLQIKVRVLISTGDAYFPHGVLGIRPLYIKEAPPEPRMGINPQEDLTKGNEASDM